MWLEIKTDLMWVVVVVGGGGGWWWWGVGVVGVEGENRNKLELVNCQYLTLILTITVSLSVSEALNLTDNPVVLFTFKRLLPLYPNNQHCKCEIIMIQLFGRKTILRACFYFYIVI